MNESFDAARILHRDAHCVVINKMSGEAMEGAGKGAKTQSTFKLLGFLATLRFAFWIPHMSGIRERDLA